MERKVDVLYLSLKQVEGRKNCFKLQNNQYQRIAIVVYCWQIVLNMYLRSKHSETMGHLLAYSAVCGTMKV